MKKDSRGVSPVVSVTLTVAITILLAAVVSASVLSLGGSTSEETPSVSFSVDQEGDQLIVTHAAGDTIDTSDLRLTGVKGWESSTQEFTAGDRISAGPAPGAERVDIVFETEDSSSVLRTVDVSNMEVSSLVVNDGFERGSENFADGWTFGRDAAESEIKQTNERSLSGDYSMKFSDLTKSYSGREILSEPVDVTSGKEYNFGVSYYLTKFSENREEDDQFLEIIWLNSSGSQISDDPFEGSNFSVFGEWREFSQRNKAPSDAVAAKLEISAKEGDTQDPDVYWDEAFIEPVP